MNKTHRERNAKLFPEITAKDLEDIVRARVRSLKYKKWIRKNNMRKKQRNQRIKILKKYEK